MKPILLLVHGWGFGASFWSPLRAALPEVEAVTWDLGFRGAPAKPAPPAGRPVVAVGHSFGLLWLLRRRPLPWQALVSINGFPRFTRSDDFPAGVAPRLLQRMIDRLAEAPQQVYSEFMHRCGEPAPDPEGLDVKALGDGLRALAEWDGRPATVDLVLAGRDDPIAPPALTEAAFGASAVEWHVGGHLLPRQDPAWCAGHLRRLMEKFG